MNNKTDWDLQFELAKEGRIDEIDSGIKLRCWNSINKIAAHYTKPVFRNNINVNVHYGVSGSGKSHKVFTQLEKDGVPYYIKDSMTKWFDGYKGETIGVIDEFRGVVSIERVLTWFDRYPCTVEIKGSTVPLKIESWYVMSNISPDEWYPDLDDATKSALKRRLTHVTKWNFKYIERSIDQVLEDIFNN